MIDTEKVIAVAERAIYIGAGKEQLFTAEEIQALVSILREAEKDAARYRWLRDNCTTTQADCLGPIFVMTVRRKEHLFNVGLSIDQAMKEKGDE